MLLSTLINLQDKNAKQETEKLELENRELKQRIEQLEQINSQLKKEAVPIVNTKEQNRNCWSDDKVEEFTYILIKNIESKHLSKATIMEVCLF